LVTEVINQSFILTAGRQTMYSMMTDSMVLKHEFFMSTVYHFINSNKR